MDQIPLLNTILHTDSISWIIHLIMFYILSRWSGIKWIWAIILVFSVEVWETVDWALANPIRWWTRFDTFMDIVSGCLAIFAAEKMKRDS